LFIAQPPGFAHLFNEFTNDRYFGLFQFTADHIREDGMTNSQQAELKENLMLGKAPSGPAKIS
jgi:hypothetical protein